MVPVSSWCQSIVDVQILVIPHENCWWETKNNSFSRPLQSCNCCQQGQDEWRIEPPSLDRNLYIRCIIRWYTIYNCRFLKCTMETKGENPSSLIRKGVAKHHFLWSTSMVHRLKHVDFEWFSKRCRQVVLHPLSCPERQACNPWHLAVRWSDTDATSATWPARNNDVKLLLSFSRTIYSININYGDSRCFIAEGTDKLTGDLFSRHSWRWSSQVIVSTKFSENLIIYL